jgi:hypothetical protein
MGEITKKEDEWQRRATAAAIAAARKIAGGSGSLMNTPVGRLSDLQLGWIITAGIFGWVQTRVEQAIAEGLDHEQAVRMTGLTPSPCDVAVIHSILPALADQAAIDWSLPLSVWSKEMMSDFLLSAWQLINKAEIARDHGPGGILRRSAAAPAPVEMPMTTPDDHLSIPEFLRRTPPKDWDGKKGDEIPFDL